MIEEDDPGIEEQPTAMAYFLRRIKLAQICREIVDTVPIEVSALLQMPYERIIDLDKKLVDFLATLPYFFKIDSDSRLRTAPLQDLYPQLALLRYSITQAAHSRRCKLHQRFLFRQSIDERYVYSREACIESARAVIQSDQHIVCPDPPWLATARRGIATHFKHLATVILVMDLSFNTNTSDREEIKAEVKDVLEAFEGARHVSPLLAHFLDSLHQVLLKNEVHLGPLIPRAVQITEPAIIFDPNIHYTGNREDSQIPTMDRDPIDASLDPAFEDLWRRAAYDDPVLDLPAWDDIISSLDSQPL